MGPENALPHSQLYGSAEEYVEALLEFITTSDILQTLCGGVHILDFLTREPDLFDAVIPPEWRDWLRLFEISDVLDLLMREDLTSLTEEPSREQTFDFVEGSGHCLPTKSKQWRRGPVPPKSLLHYIRSVRSLSLDRSFHMDNISSKTPLRRGLSRQLAVGMKPKKAHEVENFAAFVDGLVSELSANNVHQITHLVDFGSGQNYLGRVLASPIYDRRVVAIESKQSNITGAVEMDISARLAQKMVIRRNKKAFRMQGTQPINGIGEATTAKQTPSAAPLTVSENTRPTGEARRTSPNTLISQSRSHNIQYIEHIISDGNLDEVISEMNCKGTAKWTDGGPEPAYHGKSSKLCQKTACILPLCHAHHEQV